MQFTILTYDTIDSTNTEALKQAKQGADEGLCIVAREQTAGRGRHGRTWISEKDAGLYFSIVLRPKIETRFLTLITPMSGIAVYDTLKGIGLSPDIKWVNDILIDEKKICGILAETTETPDGIAVIVGIGINLKRGNRPSEIAGGITSVEEETGQSVTAESLIDALLTSIDEKYAILNSEDGPSRTVEEWKGRSSYFSGKNVRVVTAQETFTGTTVGLEPNGALRVKRPDGSVAVVQAGDVEQIRAAN